ncbi:glycosyltransferase family 9 protein [Flavobacterium capsici]|uniref:Glycosyltransferase family 9 protein n=1 Tax=Flavobacterium capsici TaxID=3075618 RepID=A0AA96F442_9FLAO|nr:MULTISPECIES: glycosyltransferase family 9 protein [unclassified Flavobacterium]WNM20443.1 glycosyltransferase family 9 protein [Flavobacterium sp. PMR2A8]WNM23149.1 glycosyltransferase family 9 protein [Flavobacterium sp. PMTSA4]
MGDVAMTVPVIRAFVEQNSDVKITFVSRPFFKPFFDGVENVNFFTVDVKKRHKGFFGLLKLYSDLKKLNIDAVADLHNVLRSQIIRTLFSLSGKKVAATDKGRAEKKALTRAENKIFQPVKSMVQRHVDTFNNLGFRVNLSNPKFSEKAILSREIIAFSGEKQNFNWIGIAPFAQYESKVYPLDLMQKVIDDLAENKNFKIFLFGGGNKEIELLNQFSKNKENVINLAGKIPFQHELHLISNLDIMLSMDSGNAHIAAMLGVKVITLWGATHPFAGFAPFNQPLENCLTSDREQFPLLPTSVYGNKKVVGYEYVMRTISVENIIEKINSNLA